MKSSSPISVGPTIQPAPDWWGRLHARHALLADAGALFTSAGVNAGLGFLFWVVAARLYSAENVGIGTAAISAMALVGNISRLGLDVALVRLLPGRSPGQRQSVINASLAVVAVVGMLAGLVFALQPVFANETSRLLRQRLWVMLGFALTCAGWGVGLVLEQVLVVNKRGQYVVWKNLAFSLSKLVALAPLVLPVIDQRLSVLTATAIGVAAGLVVGLQGLRTNATRQWGAMRIGLTEVRSSLAGYALKNYISALIAGLPGWLLPLIVVERSGARAAAYFYTSWMIMSIVNNGPAALGSALLAEGARQGQASQPLLRKAYTYALLFMVPAVLAILVAGQWLTPIFGRTYAEGGRELLPYLAIAGLPFAIVQISFMELRLEKELLVLCAAATLLSAITLVGSYVLLPVLGLIAIGIVWLMSCSLTAILSLWLVGRSLTKAKENQQRDTGHQDL
jgi:O-antigen/teichoic acid export membrane protein